MPQCYYCGEIMIQHFEDCYICIGCGDKQLVSDDTRCNDKYGMGGI